MKKWERKLNNSELRVMDIIWKEEPISAKDITVHATARYAWNKNTTYTVLKGLVEKGAVQRTEPNFICTSLLPIDEVRSAETKSLIDRLFGGSPGMFLSAFFQNESLSDEDLQEIRKLIDEGERHDGAV